MEDEDPDTFGRVPMDWYFQSEREQVAFYDGDILTATFLEADPLTQPFMFLAVCDWVELSETLAQPIGMVPDLVGARTVADLTTEDLAGVLGIPHETILEWDRGRRPLPAAAAVTICKTFLWPIAMLFRSRTGWYPRTQFALEHGDLDRPC